MLRNFLVFLLAVVCVAVPVVGQETDSVAQAEPDQNAAMAQASGVAVDISFGTGVNRETRAVEGAAGQFSPEVGQVYCFTHLKGMEPPAVVTHAWYYQGKTMARVDLNVRSADWRTWSSKLVLPGWSGQWEVKILDDSGKVLGSAGFELQ